MPICHHAIPHAYSGTTSADLKKTDASRKAIKRGFGVQLVEHRDIIPPPKPCSGGHG
jgi:hypothetical protein